MIWIWDWKWNCQSLCSIREDITCSRYKDTNSPCIIWQNAADAAKKQNEKSFKANATVFMIVSEWLKANGFDGLYDPDGHCIKGCHLGTPLLCPRCRFCLPGFKVLRGSPLLNDDGDWVIGPKEDAEAALGVE